MEMKRFSGSETGNNATFPSKRIGREDNDERWADRQTTDSSAQQDGQLKDRQPQDLRSFRSSPLEPAWWSFEVEEQFSHRDLRQQLGESLQLRDDVPWWSAVGSWPIDGQHLDF